jgi:hypothetical protein
MTSDIGTRKPVTMVVGGVCASVIARRRRPMKKIGIRLLAVMFAMFLLNASVASAATLSSTTTISAIQILNNNAFLQFPSQPTGKPAACAGNNWAAFAINSDAGKALLSSAQATYLSGKRLQLYWGTTCVTGNDGVGYPSIVGLVYFN